MSSTMDTNMGSSIFQGGSVNIENATQNLEEQEELEDIKRRQQEIQSLLAKAMDDFNYDDQSTMNSSINESADYMQQYREADIDKQLEVMYNIRVKEVESLHEKLQAKEQQLADLKAQKVQSLMLSEAENDKLRTSLKNAQELLVDKCNEIRQLNDENSRALVDAESLKQMLNKLELEKRTTEFNNQELREKVAILENGRAVNPLSDAILQESHRAEVTKLQHTLEGVISKNQRLEKENSALTEKFNAVVSEKEDLIANKTEVINKLMQNVDHAQEHNREMLSNVTRLTAENERFRTQIQELEANAQVMKGFTDKTEIIKILQKELDRSKHLNAKQTFEFEKLHNEYADLLKDYKLKSAHIQLLEENIVSLEARPATDNNAAQTSGIMDSFSASEKLRGELEMYKEQCQEKHALVADLKEKIWLLEDNIANLNKKLELSTRRDSLTAALQEKAARLEEFIQNNKEPPTDTKATNTDHLSIADVPAETLEVCRTKFETDLINMEIELRKQLQEELDRNYESLRQKFDACEKCFKLVKDLEAKEQQMLVMQAKLAEAGAKPCEMCQDLSLNLVKNVEIIQHQESELEQHRINHEMDRQTILQLLQEWKVAFETLELENGALKGRLENAIKSSAAANAELAMTRKSEEDLVRMVQAKAKDAVASWSRETRKQIQRYSERVRAAKKKIDCISWKADLHVTDIEKHFKQRQTDLKQYCA